MVQTAYDLCQPSMITTTFPAKLGSSFFLPLGHFIVLWPQTWKWSKTRANPSQAISPWAALGKTSSVTTPIALISKTTTLHVRRAFLYISLPSLHDYLLNFLISRVMETDILKAGAIAESSEIESKIKWKPLRQPVITIVLFNPKEMLQGLGKLLTTSCLVVRTR